MTNNMMRGLTVLWRMGLAVGTALLAAEGVNLVCNNILDD